MSGFSIFEEAVVRGVVIVDKTLFIEEIIKSANKVTVIKRPRRFGKTSIQSMLYHFLQNKDRKENLFEGFKISKNEKFCKEH